MKNPFNNTHKEDKKLFEQGVEAANYIAELINNNAMNNCFPLGVLEESTGNYETADMWYMKGAVNGCIFCCSGVESLLERGLIDTKKNVK